MDSCLPSNSLKEGFYFEAKEENIIATLNGSHGTWYSAF